jgi:hypothetical protein
MPIRASSACRRWVTAGGVTSIFRAASASDADLANTLKKRRSSELII